MAHEAILIYETELPIPFNVTNATGIEKGSLLKLTDGMTAIITSGAEDQICGIAAEEKIASDGKTKLGVYRRGIFKMYTKAAVTIGQAVGAAADANEVQASTKTSINCKAVGIALEACNADNDLITVAFNADGVNNNVYA
jgi:predicted RecA/RadA family phage recombinase